jgi:hypothetical protein
MSYLASELSNFETVLVSQPCRYTQAQAIGRLQIGIAIVKALD